MTRISVTVKPKELCDQMLRAEHREIKRIPNKIIKRTNECKPIILHDQPKEFKLGTGHEKFFYDKIKFLHHRWQDLHQECINRGFNMTDYSDAFTGVPEKYYNDWNPDVNVIRPILVERINLRIDQMKGQPKYYSKTVSKEIIKL